MISEKVEQNKADPEFVVLTIYYRIPKELEYVYKKSFASLFKLSSRPYAIIIIVNGLIETFEMLKKWVDEINVPPNTTYQIIFLRRNLGFSRALNIGLKAAKILFGKKFKYVVIANDDLVLYDNVVDKMLEIFNKLPHEVAGMQGIILNWERKGVWYGPQYVASELASIEGIELMNGKKRVAGVNLSYVLFERPMYVTLISGCFSVFRTEAIEKCGFFWNGFELYGEDVEYPVRLWRCGYRLLYIPIIVGEHYGAASSMYLDQRMLIERAERYYNNLTLAILSIFNERVPIIPLASAILADMLLPIKVAYALLKIKSQYKKVTTKAAQNTVGNVKKRAKLRFLLTAFLIQLRLARTLIHLYLKYYKKAPTFSLKHPLEPRLMLDRLTYVKLPLTVDEDYSSLKHFKEFVLRNSNLVMILNKLKVERGKKSDAKGY